MYGPSKNDVSLLTFKKNILINYKEINRKILNYTWQEICPSQHKKMFKRLNLKYHVSPPLLLIYVQETV